MWLSYGPVPTQLVLKEAAGLQPGFPTGLSPVVQARVRLVSGLACFWGSQCLLENEVLFGKNRNKLAQEWQKASPHP